MEDKKQEDELYVASLLTWNILATTSKIVKELGDNVCGWKNIRLPKILEILRSYNSDIIFLQEAHLPSFDEDFESFMEQYNYNCERHEIILKGKNQRKSLFGNVILFKKGKFKCSHLIRGSRTLHCKLTKIEQFENLNGFEAIFSNVHFPTFFEDRGKHLISCRKMYGDLVSNNGFYEIKKIENVVLAGDFNDSLDEVNSKNRPRGLYNDILQAGFNSISVEDLKKRTRGILNIDHCVTRFNIQAKLVKNQKLESLLNQPTFENKNGIPNFNFPSDHIPVLYQLYQFQSTLPKTKERIYCDVDTCCNYASLFKLCAFHSSDELWKSIDSACCRRCGKWFQNNQFFLQHLIQDCLFIRDDDDNFCFEEENAACI